MTERQFFALAFFPFRILLFLFGLAAGILVPLTRGLLGLGWKTAKTARAMKKELVCPSGNCPPQPADGRWTCGSCGAKRDGWIWAACSVCNEAPAYVDCASCGLSIKNPLI